MTSAIRNALISTSKLSAKPGESNDLFLARVVKAIGEDISQAEWDALIPAAQDWNNVAVDAVTAAKPLPPFPDEVADAAPAPSSRRRGSAAPAEGPYVPKEGDQVTATSKRGKVVTGFIVEIVDGVAIINAEKEGPEANDVEAPLDTWAFVLAGAAPAGGAPEPEGKSDPEVGDTVEVTTARGKIIVGNIQVMEGDDLVLVDAAGGEHELIISKLKNFTVKVKANKSGATSTAGAPAAAPAAAGRRRGAGTAPAGGEAAGGAAAETKRASNAGVSVGGRINELVALNTAMTMEQVAAQLKKENLEFRDNTLSLTYNSAKKFMAMLAANKLLK